MKIADRGVGPGSPCLIVAEIGASHCQDFEVAEALVIAASNIGADAVKFQTYTPDSCAVDSDHPAYRLTQGPWAGKRLWDLYSEACMPYEWHEELFALARDCGLIPFSTPTDKAGIDFLETLDCPAYKIASHDIVYLELIRYAASTGKPVIFSTGMASNDEIDAVWEIARGGDFVGLHCIAAYPTEPSTMNLLSMGRYTPHQMGYEVLVGTRGISDHTQGYMAAVCAVAAGACIIEKHIGFDHLREKSHDGGFYSSPEELSQMIKKIREAETIMGEVKYGPTDSESTEFRRRLCWARDLPAGHVVERDDIKAMCGSEGVLANKLDSMVGVVLAAPMATDHPVYEYDTTKITFC